MTELIELGNKSAEPKTVEMAAKAIRAGKVIAVPTDTLYVLVADPFNLSAVAAVFQAKGREPHRSLPILVNSLQMAEEYAVNLTARFYLLARHFWPGALTIIVPSSYKLPLRVTGNTGRLALRQSAAEIPNQLIELLDMPLIATSANRSGRPTCRSGIDVFGTMDGRVDLILDGGLISGSGATTVDITDPDWKIIRQGAVPEDALRECLES